MQADNAKYIDTVANLIQKGDFCNTNSNKLLNAVQDQLKFEIQRYVVHNILRSIFLFLIC